MTKTLQFASLVATAAAAALSAAPASAQVSQQASAQATIKKPLLITKEQDMQFGDILLSGSGTFSATVSLDTSGNFTCTDANLTCGGTTPQAALYRVAGNKGAVVSIQADDVSLQNQRAGSSSTLLLDIQAPSTVTLLNSGNPGTPFYVGGSLTVTDATEDGVYQGTFNVTANY